MDLVDVLHHLVDHTHFGSHENRAEAHQAIDDQLVPQPAPADKPAGTEGKQS